MVGRMNSLALVGIVAALVGAFVPAGAQTCTGGIAGVESTSLDVCCVAECGTCGGPGCTPANTSSLTASDCCATEIVDSGVLCSDSGAAPCILTTDAASADSVCNNGQTGIQDPDTDVCCPLECGEACGGDGCGVIPGVDGSLCCAAAILASGRICGDGVDPPCAQTSIAANDTVCSNGLPGVEADDVCCDAACGVCGGSTCGSLPGLTSDDCCVTNIQETGSLCSETGSAPCVVDPPEVEASVCSNGLPGYSNGNICCAEACGMCGGAGCGSVRGTNGATDCCAGTILAANVTCTDAAPCVMAEGTFTPSPVVAATGAPAAPTSMPTPGSRDISFSPSLSSDADSTGVPTAAPTADFSAAPTAGSRGGEFGSIAPSSAPTLSTFQPSTPSPDMTTPTSGSAALSAGSVVTFVAMAGGMFAVLAAARN